MGRIPILAECDVLVVESTLAGCWAALQAARQGHKVWLVSSSASLGHEITICLRPWISQASLESVPSGLRPFIRSCIKPETKTRDEFLLDLVKISEGLEDMLLNAGVRLLYAASPCGVLARENRVTGAVFAGKFGLNALRARRSVIDASPFSTLSRLAGVRFSKRAFASPLGREVRYSMLGNFKKGRPYKEFIFHFDLDPATPFYASRITALSREALIPAVQALKKEPGWRLVRGGNALQFEPHLRLQRRVPGLSVLGPAMDIADEEARRLSLDPFASTALVPRVLEQIPAAFVKKSGTKESVRWGTGKLSGLHFRSGEGEPLVGTGEHLLAPFKAPLAASCEILVLGGGSSGMPAALAAAKAGAQTLLVEQHADLGGTRSIGGVSAYWFGRQTPFVKSIDTAKSESLKSGLPLCMHYFELVKGAKAQILLSSVAAGVLVNNNKVYGAVFATEDGLRAVTAERVIDATGDGDLAAWAGASYRWGAQRDAMTMWFSFGKFVGTKPEASRHYHSVVDVRDAKDMTRAMISARRRVGVYGVGDFPQYYLTPRESRHIRGRARLDYEGILRQKRWPDLALVCRSNFDIKGIASSDLALCGWVDRDYTRNHNAFVPFRALLPQKFENLMVIGKAYDASHDALSLARMERDMIAMGGAAGTASALSLKQRKSLAKLEPKDLQPRLIRLGVLEPKDLNRSEPLKALKVEDLVQLARKLAVGPIDENLEEAKAKCFLGDQSGLPLVLERLRSLTKNKLPTIVGSKHQHPDHGWADEPCYLMAVASRCHDLSLVPLLESVAQKIDLRSGASGPMFNYVYALSYAAERLAHPRLLKALKILANKKQLKTLPLDADSDPRLSVDHVQERAAYLHLCVARAMARCGSRQGYEGLIRYINDPRAFLALTARGELEDLSNKNFGGDAKAWKRWLAGHPKLACVPFNKRMD
ncbi:MAG: FAD-dependent oxidoreductase [candidate division FCPU426 bacterium]